MKRSPANLQGAARIVAEYVADHPERITPFLTDGLDVQTRSKVILVSCEECKTLLVVGEAGKKAEQFERERTARDLALRNALRNPCCDRWR
jgi:hypothetical protein